MRIANRAWIPTAVGLLVIVAVAAAAGAVRDQAAKAPPGGVVVPTATTSPIPPACPVAPAICDFAAQVEFAYREGDPEGLVSPKSKFYGDIGIVDAGIGSWREAPYYPRVIGIGCSIDPGGDVCGAAFSLVLTAFPEDQQQERINRVLLGFLRDGDELPIVTVNRLIGGPFNPVTSGVDSGDCGLAGVFEVADVSCLGTRFFPYETGPAVPRAAANATPTPAPGTPGDPLEGVEIVEMAPGMQASLGYDTTVYYSTGCFGCGRPQIPNLFRAYRDSSGKLITDDLFGPLLARTGGYPTDVAADWERGHLLVLVCTTGYCGGEGDPSPDAAQKLFRSRDGGVTFTEEPSEDLPVGAFLYGFAEDEVVVGIGERKGLDFVLRHFRYPSNSPIEPPAGLAPAEPVLDHEGRIVWRTYRPANGAFDAAGRLLIPSGTGRELARLSAMPPGWLALWTRDAAPAYSFGLYDGVLDLAGAFSHNNYVDFRGQLPNGLLYGTVELSEPFGFGVDGGSDACKQAQSFYPALVDWNTGSIHPIIELGDCVEGRHKALNAMIPRPVVRVNTGGDCLNVRKEATTASESLGCFADGVLLMPRLGANPGPEGWLAVSTPALEPGWVAEEFIAR